MPTISTTKFFIVLIAIVAGVLLWFFGAIFIAQWFWGERVLLGEFLIAYITYRLSKIMTFKAKMEHRKAVRDDCEKLLDKIRQGERRKVEIVNVKKYEKYYPNNEDDGNGYTYLHPEFKSYRHDGVEFFLEIIPAYKKSDGSFVFKRGSDSGMVKEENAFFVGVIPYEWIEYIDLNGDEYDPWPQLYVDFKGFAKSPYKYFKYYVIRDLYDKSCDPIDWGWKQIYEKRNRWIEVLHFLPDRSFTT